MRSVEPGGRQESIESGVTVIAAPSGILTRFGRRSFLHPTLASFASVAADARETARTITESTTARDSVLSSARRGGRETPSPRRRHRRV